MCHVLIIEDEPIIAMDLEEVLAAAGATSFAFATSEEAAVAAALERAPAIITSDVKLAPGSGPAAVQAIQARLGAIPVIFITGTPEDCRPCHPSGIIVSKPFDPSAIRRAFQNMVSGQHMVSGTRH